MPKLTAVLFDLDGTLINTNELIIASFQHTLATCTGRALPRAEIEASFGEPLYLTMLRHAGGNAALAEHMLNVYRSFNTSHHDTMTASFPGVAEGMQQLYAAGVLLAVVTSKYTQLALRGLRLFGLEALVETVVGMDQVSRHKPDPEGCLVALARMGVAAGSDVAMVGDSPLDLEAGRRAGLRSIAVGWSALDPAVLAAQAPTFWAQSFADLVAYSLDAPPLPSVRPGA